MSPEHLVQKKMLKIKCDESLLEDHGPTWKRFPMAILDILNIKIRMESSYL